MAVLNRIVIDVVTEEELSERRMEIIAREATDYVHTIVMEPEDECHDEVDKLSHTHVHDTAEGERCSVCVNFARDYRSGDSVLAG
jgi:hypothetical protein